MSHLLKVSSLSSNSAVTKKELTMPVHIAERSLRPDSSKPPRISSFAHSLIPVNDDRRDHSVAIPITKLLANEG